MVVSNAFDQWNDENIQDLPNGASHVNEILWLIFGLLEMANYMLFTIPSRYEAPTTAALFRRNLETDRSAL
jgi:hypothetical protein